MDWLADKYRQSPRAGLSRRAGWSLLISVAIFAASLVFVSRCARS